MSTLSDIKAALGAKLEAEREWEKYVDVLVPSEESRHAALIVGRARNRMVGLLTDDTIGALIAVAEAACAPVYSGINDEDDVPMDTLLYRWQTNLNTALAPLVKEENDDRA